jgi:hypothetical protein
MPVCINCRTCDVLRFRCEGPGSNALAMLSYEIDGSILTVRASGTTTLAQRQPVFDAIRDDTSVPQDALILIDVREFDFGLSEYLLSDRLRVFFDHLGAKCGPMLAVIIPSGLGADQARVFKSKAIDFGMRVRLFSDEQSAREWLNGQRHNRVQHKHR